MSDNMMKKDLLKRAKVEFYKILESCELCPRMCRVNRLENERGFCGAGSHLKIAAALPHLHEEPPISGQFGTGNLFFSYCNMKCVYCQNYEISQLHRGAQITPENLAEKMLELQAQKVHSIGLVSSTHFLPFIIDSLEIASGMGLDLPLIYNTNGYERVEILKLLDGIIDVYLPDMRYSSNKTAKNYSDTGNYTDYNRKAVKEMFRQTGHPVFNEKGIIQKGLIIRYLVIPENVTDSGRTFAFIKNSISEDAFVSIMAQYFPTFHAPSFPPLNRKINQEEYDKVIENFFNSGLKNGWMQELDSADEKYVPDFI